MTAAGDGFFFFLNFFFFFYHSYFRLQDTFVSPGSRNDTIIKGIYMEKMKKWKEKAAAMFVDVLLIAAAASCVCIVPGCTDIGPEEIPGTADEGTDEGYGEYEKITVTFRTYVSDTFSDGTDLLSTKVSESEAEDIMISVYCDGSLVETLDLQDSRDGEMELDAGRYYSYYATANIARVTIPESESSMKSSRVNVTPMEPSGGIPMATSGGFTVTGDGTDIQVIFKRLYSKILFSVDFDDVPGMEITSARIRQAATSVSLFTESAADDVADGDAASSADIRDLNDGEAITFYLPENCQGVLLPSNDDSWDKIPDNISGEADICSYIEAECEFDGSGDLFGNVTYRFYLGQDAVSDFNVIRNTENSVTLKLSRDALTTPSWQVEPEVYADVPLFVLNKESSVWYSSHGTTEHLSIGHMTYWEKAVRGGNMYLVIGHTDLTGGSGLAGISSDGKTWKVIELGYCLEDVVYGNGIFLGMTDDCQGYFSYDGEYWNPTTLPSRNITHIEFGNGKFLAIKDSGSAYYSSDGRNWTSTTSFIPVHFTSLMEYGDGKFFIMNNSREAAVSSDGISWKQGTCSFDGNYLIFQDIVYGNGIFLLSTYDNVYMSEDGFTWKETDISSSWEDFLLDYKDGVFAATFKIQGAGQYFGTATSLDGITWTFIDDIRTLNGIDICIL